MVSHSAAAATIATAAAVAEAMFTPAMTIAPACPRPHAKEDASIEVSRTVIPIGCTGVRSIVIITVRTNGWNTDADDNLRLRGWCDRHPYKQRGSAEKSF
jgi:hypothetical protein